MGGEKKRKGREREERKRGTSERKRDGRGGGAGGAKTETVFVSARDTNGTNFLFPQVRTIAPVLLRRVFLQMEHTDLSEQIDSAVLQSCRAQLLVAVQSEPSPPIRRKICDAIAELARSSIGGFLTSHPFLHSFYSLSLLSIFIPLFSCLADEGDVNHWPEILKFLFNSCDLAQPHLYESALHIIR